MTSGRSQYSQEIINDSNKSSKTAYSSQKVEDLVAGSVPTNKAVLDKFSEDASNKLLWGGNPIEGGSSSIKLSEKTDNLIENLENQANPDDDGLYLKIDNKDVLDKLSENASGDLEYDGNPITGTTYTAGTNVTITGSNNKINAKDTTKILDFQASHEYEVGEALVTPEGLVYKCTTAHTSGSSVDLTKFELVTKLVQNEGPIAEGVLTGLTTSNSWQKYGITNITNTAVLSADGCITLPETGYYFVQMDVYVVTNASGGSKWSCVNTSPSAGNQNPVLVGNYEGASTWASPAITGVISGNKNDKFYIWSQHIGVSDATRVGTPKIKIYKLKGTAKYDASKPNLWPTNLELDLGDGLYGFRKIGTITADKKVCDIHKLKENNCLINLISSGGSFFGYNYYASINSTIMWDNLVTLTSAVRVGSNGRDIYLETYSTEKRTDAPYDVWFTYTK